MIKKTLLIFLMISIIISGFACKSDSEINKNGISIVTTIFPAYDFARAVAGKNCDVHMLITPGTEVHSFEPTPKDMILLQECDLFIYTGGESDVWVESILNSNEYSELRSIKMMDSVSVVNEEIKPGMEYDEEEVEPDEHVWTSPINAIEICKMIAENLCALDAENAESYTTNCHSYIEQLEDVDAELRTVAASIENKTLVFADRFPMRYFAEEYGFDYYAAFPGCSSQTEASATTLVFLIEKINEQKIPAVFSLEFSNGKMADTVCAETGAKSYTLHSCHNVSKADFDDGVTYVSLMHKNALTLKEAFGV